MFIVLDLYFNLIFTVMNNKIKCFDMIKKQRYNLIAPVDIMGCYSVPKVVNEDNQKLYVLISLLLSSQTRDEINFQSMLNLISSEREKIENKNVIRYKNNFTTTGNCLELDFNGELYKVYNQNDFDELLKNHLPPVNWSIDTILAMTIEEIDKCIEKVGFHNRKSVAIKSVCEHIKNNGYPATLKECVKLKGIGLKMGLLFINKFYGKEGTSVDTHVHRICNRIGLVKTKRPDQTSKELEYVFYEEDVDVNKVLVGFGQLVCCAIKPKCTICEARKYCDYNKKW